MINLNTKNRDLKILSEKFYFRIKNKLTAEIRASKAYLNTFSTSKSNIPLGDFIECKIEDLITLPLHELVLTFEDELEQLIISNYTRNNKIDSDFKKTINKILFYNSHDAWQAYQLAIDIGNSTCPYCNRTYITTMGSDTKKFARGDFDHFLPKSIYPYLRLSFYNLIPCCVICNRNAKKADETSLTNNIYPYIEGFENKTIFTYLPKNYEDIIGRGRPEINFLFTGTDEQIVKSKENIKLFRLREQYIIHTQELNDLVNKRRVFSDSYLNELQNDYPQLIKSYDDAYLLAFGAELDLINDEKRPLSKFTRDIVDELGLIKYIE